MVRLCNKFSMVHGTCVIALICFNSVCEPHRNAFYVLQSYLMQAHRDGSGAGWNILNIIWSSWLRRSCVTPLFISDTAVEVVSSTSHTPSSALRTQCHRLRGHSSIGTNWISWEDHTCPIRPDQRSTEKSILSSCISLWPGGSRTSGWKKVKRAGLSSHFAALKRCMSRAGISSAIHHIPTVDSCPSWALKRGSAAFVAGPTSCIMAFSSLRNKCSQYTVHTVHTYNVHICTQTHNCIYIQT